MNTHCLDVDLGARAREAGNSHKWVIVEIIYLYFDNSKNKKFSKRRKIQHRLLHTKSISTQFWFPKDATNP